VRDACVLCGSTDVQRRDQLGRSVGPKRLFRQLGGVLPGAPFVTGARCDDCDLGVRRHADRAHPPLCHVMTSLGRTDLDLEADVWAAVVLTARRGGRPDPAPPSEPWGFTTRGSGVDLDAFPDPDRLSADEVAKLRELLGAS
jgi:hypothetical protein